MPGEAPANPGTTAKSSSQSTPAAHNATAISARERERQNRASMAMAPSQQQSPIPSYHSQNPFHRGMGHPPSQQQQQSMGPPEARLPSVSSSMDTSSSFASPPRRGNMPQNEMSGPPPPPPPHPAYTGHPYSYPPYGYSPYGHPPGYYSYPPHPGYYSYPPPPGSYPGYGPTGYPTQQQASKLPPPQSSAEKLKPKQSPSRPSKPSPVSDYAASSGAVSESSSTAFSQGSTTSNVQSKLNVDIEHERKRAAADPDVIPMKTDFRFFVDDFKDQVRAAAEQELGDRMNDEDALYLLYSNMNARLIKEWENFDPKVRESYFLKEEEDRKRFMDEEEVVSRHCATLTARSRSPRPEGSEGGSGPDDDEEDGDEDEESQTKKRASPTLEESPSKRNRVESGGRVSIPVDSATESRRNENKSKGNMDDSKTDGRTEEGIKVDESRPDFSGSGNKFASGETQDSTRI